MGESDYGVIPYEVDEITAWLNTWLNDNMPGMIEDALPTDFYFHYFHPDVYLFLYAATYINHVEYTENTAVPTGWIQKFTTDAIDVTNRDWLRFTVNIKAPGTPLGVMKVTDSDGNNLTICIVPDTNNTKNEITVDGENYSTVTGYIFVRSLSGNQQFKIWLKTTGGSGDIYIDEFYLYEQSIE